MHFDAAELAPSTESETDILKASTDVRYSPRKQTSLAAIAMSALCQKRL
jgi:hypothetical protein